MNNLERNGNERTQASSSKATQSQYTYRPYT